MEAYIRLFIAGFFLFCLGCSSTSTPDAGLDAFDGAGDTGADESPPDAFDGDGDAGADESPPDASDDDTLDCSVRVFEDDVQIPMGDGKTLAAYVWRPEQADCKVPTILIQTPYGKENAKEVWFDAGNNPLFSDTHYAFVIVDWRGFFGSADAEVEQPNYGQDGYDTVEWIAAQDWSDGKVGTWGVSALCVQQYRTALTHPPHLKAAVPIFCQMNTTYDQYYPGGVLRQEYFDFTTAYFHSGNIVTNHPTRDLVWKGVESAYHPEEIDVPMLLVSGWYDLFNTATIRDFNAISEVGALPARNEHRLLIGPWIHAATGGETSGNRQLDEQELNYYDADKKIQVDSLAFFDKHLRNLPSDADGWKRVRWITDGVRQEHDSDNWPPSDTTDLVYYLTQEGLLDSSVPSDGQKVYSYDPDNPSITVGGCTLLPSLKHGPRYQDDVLASDEATAFVSAPLDSTLSIRGDVQLSMRVSTTGADTDFAIRLTDVDQEGKHLLIGEGIQRLKLSEDLGHAITVQAGKAYDITVSLTNEQGYDFVQGHRVGLILSSSNFNRFAKNPNNGDDFYDGPNDPVIVQNTIYTGAETFLTLHVSN